MSVKVGALRASPAHCTSLLAMSPLLQRAGDVSGPKV